MKHRDWYFKDWESKEQIGSDGVPHWVLVYTGRYYLLPEPVARFKLYCLFTTLFYTSAFIYLSFFPSAGGMDLWVGNIGLLQVIPLIFFGLAVFPLVRAPRAMTYRRYHRIVHRLRWGASLAVVILFAQLVSELYYIAFHRSLEGEILYCTVLLLDFLLTSLFAFFILRIKFSTTDKPGSEPLPADE